MKAPSSVFMMILMMRRGLTCAPAPCSCRKCADGKVRICLHHSSLPYPGSTTSTFPETATAAVTSAPAEMNFAAATPVAAAFVGSSATWRTSQRCERGFGFGTWGTLGLAYNPTSSDPSQQHNIVPPFMLHGRPLPNCPRFPRLKVVSHCAIPSASLILRRRTGGSGRVGSSAVAFFRGSIPPCLKLTWIAGATFECART